MNYFKLVKQLLLVQALLSERLVFAQAITGFQGERYEIPFSRVEWADGDIYFSGFLGMTYDKPPAKVLAREIKNVEGFYYLRHPDEMKRDELHKFDRFYFIETSHLHGIKNGKINIRYRYNVVDRVDYSTDWPLAGMHSHLICIRDLDKPLTKYPNIPLPIVTDPNGYKWDNKYKGPEAYRYTTEIGWLLLRTGFYHSFDVKPKERSVILDDHYEHPFSNLETCLGVVLYDHSNMYAINKSTVLESTTITITWDGETVQ